MPFPIIPLAIAAYGEISAERQKAQAKAALDKLNATPRPSYETGQQIYDQANANAKGLSPQEMAMAQQHLNQLNNTRYQLGVQRNPNLSGAVQAGVNYGSVQGQLGLAAQDAAARRQNLQQLIGLYGNQSNRQSASDIAYRNEVERNYGAAYRNGQQNEMTNVQGAGGAIYNQQLNEQNFNNQYKLNNQFLALRGYGGGYNQNYPPPTSMAYNNQMTPSLSYKDTSIPTDYSSPSAYRNF